jgi:hypothetical protein
MKKSKSFESNQSSSIDENDTSKQLNKLFDASFTHNFANLSIKTTTATTTADTFLIDLSKQKPLVCFLSEQERILEIWNYERDLIELSNKKLIDENGSMIIDMKINPQIGSDLCVLHSDKICFYKIILNDLKLESSFKICKKIT